MVYWLDAKKVGFPDPHNAEEDGLLAVGGALTPDWLVTAYSYGIFPWFGFRENEDILWWCPKQRFVIFPDEIHVSHSMEQLLRKNRYRISLNEAFDEVIRGCSKAQERDSQRGAWLGDDMIHAYTELYEQGFAVSVEVWEKSTNETDESGEPKEHLVGGLYGVNIGKNFFGESMFSLVPSASKLALIFLARIMQGRGGLIDCQFETPHLKTMGGRMISYDEYMTYLD